jgi:hypothetical protein
MTRWVWVACLLFNPSFAHAAKIVPFVEGGRIGVRVQSLAFPETLPKELRSGLTNRVLLRLNLSDGAEIRATANISIELKYDLWDERFDTEVLVDGAPAHSTSLRTVNEALLWLSDLTLAAVFEAPSGPRPLTVKAEVLLNPIERERMDRIRQWVKENSSYVPFEGGPGTASSESSSNAVFNKIFEQYASGRDYASIWRQDLVSSPFTVSSSAQFPK